MTHLENPEYLDQSPSLPDYAVDKDALHRITIRSMRGLNTDPAIVLKLCNLISSLLDNPTGYHYRLGMDNGINQCAIRLEVLSLKEDEFIDLCDIARKLRQKAAL